jgi:serine/threonine protein kinase
VCSCSALNSNKKKPSNIFLDVDSSNGSVNVRLGDFGLATTHRSRTNDETDKDSNGEFDEFDIENGRLTGEMHSVLEWSSGNESMTGGVGTTFYRAPEQEGKFTPHFNNNGDNSSYTVQADIFSFGVILFEVFHPPFTTHMERAETLTVLRGDRHFDHLPHKLDFELKEKAHERFPEFFVNSVSQNAQRYVHMNSFCPCMVFSQRETVLD